MSTMYNNDAMMDKALLEWWIELESDKAGRASLRRACSLTAVIMTKPYLRLCQRLGTGEWPDRRKDRLAVVVGLLAHVKQNDDQPIARRMSKPSEGGNRPAVSELRFLRLLDSPDLDALFTGLRRALPV